MSAQQSQDVEFHEIANVFPLLEYEDFSKLIEDIRAHGLIEPITLYEEKILDGRNRHRACIAAGVAPRYLVYDGDDPAAFVWSKNETRRHLSASQRAMAATALIPYLKAQAKERQGTRTDIVSKSTQSSPAATAPARVSGRAREQAAKIAGVGATTMGEAQALVEQVTGGTMTVHSAVQTLREPAETADDEGDEEYDAEFWDRARIVSMVLLRLHSLRVDAQERELPVSPDSVEVWWMEVPLEGWEYVATDLRWFRDNGQTIVDELLARIERGEVPPRRSIEEQRAQEKRDAKRAARKAERAEKRAE